MFQKICEFATTDVFNNAEATGAAEAVYDTKECKDLISEDNIVILREDLWLEEVYGA